MIVREIVYKVDEDNKIIMILIIDNRIIISVIGSTIEMVEINKNFILEIIIL